MMPDRPSNSRSVVQTWIEEALAIGDEDTEQRAKFEQLMPVAIVAGEP